MTALLVTGACTGSDPGIVKNDCPGTPKIVSLDQAGPFWDGLERVHFTVPDGTPSAIQLETFDPAPGTWSGFQSTFLEQEDDDSYVATANISPTEDTRTASFKLRVRALLDSCPPSDWATTEAFTIGDPLSDTSWKAHVDVIDSSLFLQVAVTMGAATANGPYTLGTGGVDHTMQFHASGAVDEIWAFGIDSAHPGELYAGCKFSIHYVGQWHWSFPSLPQLRIVITDLVPAPTPLAGSNCTSPPVLELAINQAGFTSKLSQSEVVPTIDYSRLLNATPGKVIWQGFQTREIERLSQQPPILQGLSDNLGVDQDSVVQGSISFFNNAEYVKQ